MAWILQGGVFHFVVGVWGFSIRCFYETKGLFMETCFFLFLKKEQKKKRTFLLGGHICF